MQSALETATLFALRSQRQYAELEKQCRKHCKGGSAPLNVSGTTKYARHTATVIVHAASSAPTAHIGSGRPRASGHTLRFLRVSLTAPPLPSCPVLCEVADTLCTALLAALLSVRALPDPVRLSFTCASVTMWRQPALLQWLQHLPAPACLLQAPHPEGCASIS